MAKSYTVEELREIGYREMTKGQCLADIGRVVSFRGHLRSELTKRDLNSIHWYITGEQVVPFIDFGTERSPKKFRLRKAVATACGFPYPDHGYRGEDGDSRPFRRNELRAVVRKLRNTDEKRQFNS